MGGKISGALAVAAATGLAIGMGIARAGPNDSRRRSDQAPGQSDRQSKLRPLLDRIDRIEARVSAIEARPIPEIISAATLDLRFERQEEALEALRAEVNEIRQKEADRELAQLGALFAEVKHPLLTGRVTAMNKLRR